LIKSDPVTWKNLKTKITTSSARRSKYFSRSNLPSDQFPLVEAAVVKNRKNSPVKDFSQAKWAN